MSKIRKHCTFKFYIFFPFVISVVTLVGAARFFDLSIFEEMEKKSEDKKSIPQLIKGDLENMKMFMSKLSSSDKSDT